MLWRNSRSFQEWEEKPTDIRCQLPQEALLEPSSPVTLHHTESVTLYTLPRPSQPFPSLLPGEHSLLRVGTRQSGICCVPRPPLWACHLGWKTLGLKLRLPLALALHALLAVLLYLHVWVLPFFLAPPTPELGLSTGAAVRRASGNFWERSLSKPSAPSLLRTSDLQC